MCIWDLIANIHHKLYTSHTHTLCCVCIDGFHTTLAVMLFCVSLPINKFSYFVVSFGFVVLCCGFGSVNSPEVLCIHFIQILVVLRCEHQTMDYTQTHRSLCGRGHLLAIVDKSYSFLFIKLQKIHLKYSFTRTFSLHCMRTPHIVCMHTSDGIFFYIVKYEER